MILLLLQILTVWFALSIAAVLGYNLAKYEVQRRYERNRR